MIRGTRATVGERPERRHGLTRRQALARGLGAGFGAYAAGALPLGGTPDAASAASGGAAFGRAAVALTDADADALKANIGKRAAVTDLAVLMPWRADVARALKWLNPNAKCMMYQNFGAVWAGNPPGHNADANSSCAVRYVDAIWHDGSNPNTRWLLKDGNGNLIRPSQWPNLAYTNPTGSRYVSHAAFSALGRLGTRGKPWDGVWLDDVNPAAYTDGSNWGVQSWASRLMDALGAYADQLRIRGFLVMTNVGWLPGHPDWATWAMAEHIDGVACEHFDKDIVDALGTLQWAARHGRYFVAISYVFDPTYPVGALLLGSADKRQMSCVPGVPTHTAYDKAIWLGSPKQDCHAANGTYLRPFQGGDVAVAPSRQAAAVLPG